MYYIQDKFHDESNRNCVLYYVIHFIIRRVIYYEDNCIWNTKRWNW